MLAPNYLIQVTDAWIGLDQDMIMAGVSLEQDGDGGTTAP